MNKKEKERFLENSATMLAGFFYGRNHKTDIAGLLKSMGLTKEEWLAIRNTERYIALLEPEDRNEVSDIFDKS